jgi:hypothetical protein
VSEATSPFVARCDVCGERTSTTEPNDVVRFYRRHHAVTGHDVVWERTPSDLATPPAGTEIRAVDAALTALTADADGVPLGLLSAALSANGWTVGETLDAVHERRLRGALWEPRDDHVAAV